MKKALLLLVILMGTLGFAQEATNQENSQEKSIPGIVLGKFVFSPSVEFAYENKDNVFLTESDTKSDQIYLARPKLMLELPKEDSYLRFSWVPQYRKFKDFELKENWTHFVNMEANLKTSGGLELRVADEYINKGTLEVSEVDPGHELVFNDVPFDKNSAMVDMKYFLDDTNGFGIYADYAKLDFNQTQSPIWYDYKTSTFGATYQRYLGPLLRMAFGANYSDFDPQDTLALNHKYNGMDYFVRFYGDFSPTVNASVKVGYQDLSYDQSSRDYTGWDTEVQLIWNFANDRNLTAGLIRTAYPSNYMDDTTYTHSGVKLAYNFKMVEKLFGSLGADFSKNDYNELARTDDTWSVSGCVGYHFNPLFSMRLNLQHEVRNSTVTCEQGCDYKQNSILLNALFGF